MRDNPADDSLVQLLDRTSLCVASPEPGVAAHDGDAGFKETLLQYYSAAENNAVEQLIQLKSQLKDAPTYDFWRILMDGITTITGSQYGFVSRRILVDDQSSTVEMPPIGEPGSCLLGVAFYWNDGGQMQNMARDYKYWAYGAPCSGMKHDKVFLVPNGLPKFFPNNPNQLPFPADAYIGIPLFAEGKCLGHVGIMWNKEALHTLTLRWAYIEMLLHSIEDIVLDRLLDGRGHDRESKQEAAPKVIPTEAVTAAQSLKPYARSLSHELRTPMQGVVGMLDVMHATVQESLEGQNDPNVRRVFKALRENIEVIQDSSRRAVEAADNVVHAYDLNMQVPNTPISPNDDKNLELQPLIGSSLHLPQLVSGETTLSGFRGSKRQRLSDSPEELHRPPLKHRILRPSHSDNARDVSPHTASLKTAVSEVEGMTDAIEDIVAPSGGFKHHVSSSVDLEPPADASEPDSAATPGLRQTDLRELLQVIINESLRVGGRPESAFARENTGGELIDLKTRTADGGLSSKTIDWSVDPGIPQTLLLDERGLAKLVSCVFLNAIKFTEEGRITLKASMTSRGKFVMIRVTDTGPGIPEDFLPFLFKPFSREDDSLTRPKDGLGLGLLVAKGLARKIGGDLICTKSDVSGPHKGTEFELRVPLLTSHRSSRSSTPRRTPTPGRFSAPEFPSSHNQALGNSQHAQHIFQAQPLSSTTGIPDSLGSSSSSRRTSLSRTQDAPSRRQSLKQGLAYDRELAKKYPLTILVADDNTLNRRLLVNMLEKLGYKDVYQAYNGEDAVQQMKIDRSSQGEKKIDVILMDIWMPKMDGYEATKRIYAMEKERQEKKTSHGQENTATMNNVGVTIVAVTADVTDSALERVSAIGMAGYLTKPYTLIDLERKILEVCIGGGVLEKV